MTKKILIVGPAWVGDMVMAQCLFKLLQPAVIDVLAPAWSLPLLARMSEVANTIVLPFGHGELNLRGRYRLGKALRANHYDQAIVLPNSFKSALIPWFAQIPVRTGWMREMRYGLLNDYRKLDKNKYPLMIERFMALGLDANAALPKDYPMPHLQVSLKENHSSLPILALCPGAEFGPAKRWPEKYYAEVANAKLAEGWRVWIFGSAKDASIAAEIMRLTEDRCVNYAGKTTLEEAIDLLFLSTSVLTNDSGLMHIAAALHKPLIALYGPTTSTFTPPLDQQAKTLTLSLDCQPCFKRVCPLDHHRCMEELKPGAVLLELETL